MKQMTMVQLESLFASDGSNPNPEVDPRPLLTEAEVVFGVDVMTRKLVLVFGRNLLEAIARAGKKRAVRMLGVEIDLKTDDLEKLIALMIVVKGKHDYEVEEERYEEGKP